MPCTSIVIEEVAKKFQHKWIFKGIDCSLFKDDVIAITGNNGAGKSTFLKILSGHLTPNKGSILFYDDAQKKIERDYIYKEITFAAPYINIMARLTLRENIEFYMRFKSLQPGLDADSLIDLMQLKQAANKEIRFYSSGMQQRVKLALAICAKSSVLILDEPTTNLDEEGAAWYATILSKYIKDRIVIIASNTKSDFELCTRSLSILDYKKVKAKKL